MTYIVKTFNLPALTGLSEKQIKVHLALYEGYVKHVNLIMEQIQKLKESGTDPYVIAELRRRFAFEFNGMRLHELYFEQFEGRLTSLTTDSSLEKAIKEKYCENGLEGHIREVAGTRGIGWVVVYKDSDSSTSLTASTIHTTFVSDHEVGQLAGLPILLALDLWEHAYMVDYLPSEKKNYVDAFFANLNWSVVEKRFDDAK
ncbi:MAG: Fe-Mn family superoxide dismutase [Patescibacteria group bacterium]